MQITGLSDLDFGQQKSNNSGVKEVQEFEPTQIERLEMIFFCKNLPSAPGLHYLTEIFYSEEPPNWS